MAKINTHISQDTWGVHFSSGAAVRQADVPGGMVGFYAVAVAVENRGLEAGCVKENGLRNAARQATANAKGGLAAPPLAVPQRQTSVAG